MDAVIRHVSRVGAIGVLIVVLSHGSLYASGHGPVFGAATPTLGKGGWSFDQAWMGQALQGVVRQVVEDPLIELALNHSFFCRKDQIVPGLEARNSSLAGCQRQSRDGEALKDPRSGQKIQLVLLLQPDPGSEKLKRVRRRFSEDRTCRARRPTRPFAISGCDLDAPPVR